MEARNTQTLTRQSPLNEFAARPGNGSITRGRLDILLEANAAIAREKALYGSEREELEAEMMSNPFSPEKAFAYFGLLLGVFPPLALFLRFFLEMGPNRTGEVWMIGIFFIVDLLSAIVGFFTGKLVGKMMRNLEARSWSVLLLAAPLVGLVWGILSGGAGGIIIFVIGAFFGAILGGAVGMVALPAFAVLHRLLKRGDMIEQRHFLPLAFGITFTICSFILGL
jgi:hypothetical protein